MRPLLPGSVARGSRLVSRAGSLQSEMSCSGKAQFRASCFEDFRLMAIETGRQISDVCLCDIRVPSGQVSGSNRGSSVSSRKIEPPLSAPPINRLNGCVYTSSAPSEGARLPAKGRLCFVFPPGPARRAHEHVCVCTLRLHVCVGVK